jgi:hypothetical protein
MDNTKESVYISVHIDVLSVEERGAVLYDGSPVTLANTFRLHNHLKRRFGVLGPEHHS